MSSTTSQGIFSDELIVENSEESSFDECSIGSLESLDAPTFSPFTSDDNVSDVELETERPWIGYTQSCMDSGDGMLLEPAGDGMLLEPAALSPVSIDLQTSHLVTQTTVSSNQQAPILQSVDTDTLMVPSETTAVINNYKLLGDNIDLTIKSCFMRMDSHRNDSYHFFHCCAVKDRIDLSHLPFKKPDTCLNSVEKMTLELLPNIDCDAELTSSIAVIVSRVLATYMKFFSFAVGDVVTWHIEHAHYREMSMKSEVVGISICLWIHVKIVLQVPLGIVLHNENKGDEMVKIMYHMQQYVPAVEYSNECYIPSTMESVTTPAAALHKKLFGGDQLTAARIRGAQAAMCNGQTALKRLEGVIPVVEDWHTEVLLYEVCSIVFKLATRCIHWCHV